MTIGCNTTPSSAATPHSTPLYPPLPPPPASSYGRLLRPPLLREPSRYGYPFPTTSIPSSNSSSRSAQEDKSRSSVSARSVPTDHDATPRPRGYAVEEVHAGAEVPGGAPGGYAAGATGGYAAAAGAGLGACPIGGGHYNPYADELDGPEVVMTAKSMHAYRNLTIFRRFGHLSMVSLLMQQKELARLEEMLMDSERSGFYPVMEGTQQPHPDDGPSRNGEKKRKKLKKRRGRRGRAREGDGADLVKKGSDIETTVDDHDTLDDKDSTDLERDDSSSDEASITNKSRHRHDPPTRDEILQSLHIRLKAYYESLLLQDAVFTTLEPPRASDTSLLFELTSPVAPNANESVYGADDIYGPSHHDDLVQLGTTNRDSLEKWLLRIISRLLPHRRLSASALRERFFPWKAWESSPGVSASYQPQYVNGNNPRRFGRSSSPSPSSSSAIDAVGLLSPLTRRITRILVALATAALMLGPMAVLRFVVDERWRLVWIAGFTIVLSVGVALAMGGRKGGSGGAEGVVVVVAAYAAVLVVFVEREGRC